MRRSLALLTVFIAGLSSSGCRAPKLPNQMHAHAIAINRDGSPYQLRTRTAPELSAVYPDGKYSFDGHMNHICASIAAQPDRKQLLFFVHGGLVPLRASFESGQNQLAEIYAQSSYYPIFIDWESGIDHAYADHLWRIRGGKETQLAKLTAPLVLLSDVGRAVARIPYFYLTQIVGWVRSFGEYDYEDMQADLVKAGVSPSLASLDSDRPTFGRRAGDIVQFVLPGVPAKAVTSPILDTGGRAGWNNMTRRARNTVHGQERFGRTSVEPQYSPADGAAIALIRQLCFTLPRDVSFTFVGHSMGSIVVNEILQEIQRDPALRCLIPRVNRVVYLAAACSVREFRSSVLPQLEENPKTEFYNLCLHPYAEENEMSFGVDLLPRGSLLEYLDQYIADPQTFGDRRFGKWTNAVHAISTIPAGLRSRIHIKGFGLSENDPRKHGEMDDGPYWTEKYLLPSETKERP